MGTNPLDSEALDFTLDRGADVPLGIQLAWTLRTRIGDGRFAPGARLPGLRELADAAGVNVNTVRAVYGKLEQDGLIESKQGSGTFVAGPEPSWTDAITIAADAARQARRTGVDPREVAAALYVSPALERRSAQAQRRSRLRSQIAALEQALAELEALHPGLPEARPEEAGIDVRAQRAERTGAHLPDAAELEQIRLTLLRRLTSMQTAIDALGDTVEADRELARPTSARRTKSQSQQRGESDDASAPASRTSGGRSGRRASTRPATAGA